ncbi:M57 family metalloprotease [Aequitasia blattaphilus]
MKLEDCSRSQIQRVITHELRHALGLRHNEKSYDMSYSRY